MAAHYFITNEKVVKYIYGVYGGGWLKILTIGNIREALDDIILKYPIKKISLFGSYADGNANEDSDIDLLVEFISPNVSLFMLYNIKEEIKNKLQKEVDLIHEPVDENSLIKINKVIDIYG